ncbi:hypothetical protein D3C71_2130490 [compost metagenome]
MPSRKSHRTVLLNTLAAEKRRPGEVPRGTDSCVLMSECSFLQLRQNRRKAAYNRFRRLEASW